MATQNEAVDLMQSRFITQWADETPVAYDNDEFDTPSADVEWARFNIQFNVGFQESFGNTGNRKFRRAGLIFIQVFTPENTGSFRGTELARRALNIFDGERLGDIWFVNGVIRSAGNINGWFQTNVSIEFRYDEVK